MINCDSTCCTVSIATPTTIRSDVPPKKNCTFKPSVTNLGNAASSHSPTNGIGATLKPLIRKLDMSREHAPEYRQKLAEFRDGNMATVAELRALATPHQDQISSLQDRLEDYWQTFDPLFDWTVGEKMLSGASFLRREVVPRRDAVNAIAEEIEELNNANLAEQRAEVTRRQAAFRTDLYRLMWQCLVLGIAVALTVVFQLRILERRSVEQRLLAERAEAEMRQLSQRLVETQEDERRHLSRELHDHVGQVLTALRMELGRIERSRSPLDTRVGTAIAEAKQLVDKMFHTVRDLALGLRPSMLVEDYVRALQKRGLSDSYHLLTDREKEILHLLAEGRSNKEVATLLDVGVSTVETHRANLMQKLNLHNTAEIVLYAVRKGLIV